MRCDLHIHTVWSDGSWTPARVVGAAVEAGLNVIAVADHDTTAGVGAACSEAAAHALSVIPAVELSSTTETGREIHLLGYFVDVQAAALRAHEERAARLRLERIGRIVERLAGQGVRVELDRVVELAGSGRGMVGRPHLARAMVERGIVASIAEAFDRYIGDEHEAFVPTELARPPEALDVILRSGGVAVWAHPPQDLLAALLPDLIDAGLRGLEIYRPNAPPSRVARLEAMARDRGLLTTGGSDWHDPERNAPLGTFWVSGEKVADLFEEGSGWGGR